MVLEKQKKEAKKKGFFALGALVATPFLWGYAGTIFGLIGLGATTFLTYSWLRYRGKWGLKF